jgi:hypothetical protein
MQLSDNSEKTFSECLTALRTAIAAEDRKATPATLDSLDALLKKNREK